MLNQNDDVDDIQAIGLVCTQLSIISTMSFSRGNIFIPSLISIFILSESK
jgi:hypothetical protein